MNILSGDRDGTRGVAYLSLINKHLTYSYVKSKHLDISASLHPAWGDRKVISLLIPLLVYVQIKTTKTACYG